MEMQRNISGQRLGTGVQEEEVWLLGQPSLRKYLDHVEEMVVDGKIRARAALVGVWRSAVGRQRVDAEETNQRAGR